MNELVSMPGGYIPTDEITSRLDAMFARQASIEKLLSDSKKMAASIKKSVTSAREELSRSVKSCFICKKNIVLLISICNLKHSPKIPVEI